MDSLLLWIQIGSEEADWFHNNGLAYDAENDLVLLSARHKDAIVAVNKRTNPWHGSLEILQAGTV